MELLQKSRTTPFSYSLSTKIEKEKITEVNTVLQTHNYNKSSFVHPPAMKHGHGHRQG